MLNAYAKSFHESVVLISTTLGLGDTFVVLSQRVENDQ